MLVSALAVGLVCHAQFAVGEDVQVNEIGSIIKDGYVGDWLVCGPFPPDNWDALKASLRRRRVPLSDTDFLQNVAPEAFIEPRRGLVHSGVDTPDGRAVWESLASDSPLVELDRLYPWASSGVIYAACYIGVAIDTTIYLDLRSSSATKVWLNHAAVEPCAGDSSSAAGHDIFLLRLPRGFNLLQVKFCGMTFSEMEDVAGWPAEELREEVARSAQLLGQSSGLAFSLRVKPFTEVGSTGLGVIGRPETTGYFRGGEDGSRQEIGIELYNSSAGTLTDVHVSIESPATGAGDIARLPMLEPGEFRTVQLALAVSDEMVGSEIDARATLMAAKRKLDMPFRFTVARIPPADEKIFVVPGFHADPVWIEDQRDYMVSLLSSAEQNLLITEVDPAYGVYLSELSYLKPFYDTRPGRRAYLRELIADGRVGTGGAYNQAVEKLISGEALIKNILYGHLFHEGILGDESTVYMCWDVFGHCAQLSQILAKSGHTGVVWSKAIRGFPPVFFQQSLDGTRLIHKRVPYGLQSSDKLGLRRLLYSRLEEQRTFGLSADVRFDAGDFKAPTAWFAGSCGELTEFRPPIVVSGSGAELYFDAVQKDVREKKVDLPVTARDMGYYHQGTGLTRANLKSANRIGENLLVSASSFATMANVMGAKYPDKALDKAWRQLLFAQHHDSLTGTMCDRGYLDLMAGYREAVELGSEVLRNSLAYIAESVDTVTNAPSGNAHPVVVFNPCSWTRTDCCTVRMTFADARVQGLTVLDSKRRSVPVEVEEIQREEDGRIKSAKLKFVAQDVPSLGYKTYFVEESGTLPQLTDGDGSSIENDYFVITADPQKGGGIVSIVEKATRKQYVKKGDAPANEIVALDEEIKRREPPWEVFTTGGTAFSRDFPATVRVQKGPVTSRLIVEGDMRNCKRVQEIVLYRGVRRIDFVTRLIDYSGEGEMFMVTFPVDLNKSVPVFEERFGAVVRKRSKGYMDHRTWQWNNYSGTGLSCAYQWLDAGYSGIVDFGEAGGSFPIGMVTLVIPHDEAVRETAVDLQESLIKKGIFCTPWYDDGDIERRRNLPAEDSTQPVDMNEDLPYGTSFRISLGNPAENGYTAKLLAELEPEQKEDFEQHLTNQGFAYLFLKDAGVPEGWEPLPVLIVAAVDANGVRKAVDQLIGDFEEDATVSLPLEVNITGDVSRVDRHGFAIANVGSVLNSVENDGSVAMALMHTASWHDAEWAKPDRLPFTFVPEWKTHVFPYAVYPHDGSWRDAGVYRFGYEFNNPLIATVAETHHGALPPEMSFLQVQPDNVIVTMIKPKGNPTAALRNKEINAVEDGLIVRVYEATGVKTKAELAFFTPLTTAARADLLENEIGRVKFSENRISDTVGPFSIETYSVVPAEAAPGVSKLALGRDREPAQPVYTRFWRNNAGAAPIGYAPVNVTLDGEMQTGIHIEQGGVTINKVAVSITNDYTDREVSGTARIVTPATWRALPAEFEYRVPPGGDMTREVVVSFLKEVRTGLIKAQIEHDGQVFQDVLEVGDLKLGMIVQKDRDRISVALDNPYDDTIEGQVDIVTPVEAWSPQEVGKFSLLSVTPRTLPFAIAGGTQHELSFDIDAPSPAPQFWAVVKLSYNGHVEYMPVPGLLRNL
jgi:alpha-mannosidase